MRNTLTLLSSLALAAAASAQSTSITSSSLVASYSVTGAATFDSYTSYEYDHIGDDFFNQTSFEDDGGRMEYDLTGSTSHSHVDGTSLFAMGSQTSVAIDAPDYGAITPGADPYAQSFRGYTYVLKFAVGADGGSVTFNMHAVQSLIGAAASPLGLSQYDALGNYSGGAYARGRAVAGVTDVTDDLLNGATNANSLTGYETTSHETTTLVPTPTFELLASRTFTSTFTFGSTATSTTHYLRVFASGHAEADFYQPVPEPASVAALGLGALGLLRRRRKA